ncbi:response regulator [Paraburkholderia sp. BR10872]|uniref:response regulator n=1 Tax=Paraburkholderia sp. BR10872 TaxID=3236989 RepID=UPI0034D1D23C
MGPADFGAFEHEGWERVAQAYHTYFGDLTAQSNRAMLETLGVGRGTRFLDVACGPGYLAAAARRRGADVAGVDFSVAMVDRRIGAMPDPNILRPLRILLEAEGYRVLTALNGLAAMPVTAAGRPDVIVTDWMIPAVDGVAFCRWLKADPATATIPVVMLSAALPPCPTGNLWDVLLMKHTPIGRLLHVIGRLLDAHGTAT